MRKSLTCSCKYVSECATCGHNMLTLQLTAEANEIKHLIWVWYALKFDVRCKHMHQLFTWCSHTQLWCFSPLFLIAACRSLSWYLSRLSYDFRTTTVIVWGIDVKVMWLMCLCLHVEGLLWQKPPHSGWCTNTSPCESVSRASGCSQGFHSWAAAL